MIIRIADIPPGGRDLAFEIETTALNGRAMSVRDAPSKSYSCRFDSPASVKLHLELEGSVVSLKGLARAWYSTPCARCIEDTQQSLEVNINLLAKPVASRAAPGEQDEDLQIGYYDGKEIDCSPIVEEYLMLGIPFCVLCKESCKGLCVSCGANRNHSDCDCSTIPVEDGPFGVLKGLKIH